MNQFSILSRTINRFISLQLFCITILLLVCGIANGFIISTATINGNRHVHVFSLNSSESSSSSSTTTTTSSTRSTSSSSRREDGDRSNKRTSRSRSSSSTDSSITGVGPKAEARQRSRRRRSSSRIISADTTFDPKKLTSLQISNENASPFDLHSDSSTLTIRSAPSANELVVDAENNNSDVEIRREEEQHDNNNYEEQSNENISTTKGKSISHPHFKQMALDDLFPNLNFSKIFYTNGKFREDVRQAMRNDIFYTTPAYAGLSTKVASFMLDNDSSLQGSWNCVPKNLAYGDDIPLRMTRLTSVLKDTLGDQAPTGDEFMMKLGSLCGLNPSNHWIDIIGVKDRVVSHSWHQDTGKSYDYEDVDNIDKSRYTVMLGFPQEDAYEGTGVFSHAIKLRDEHLAPHGHNDNDPVLFEGIVDENYIVRPSFSLGKELLVYRDIDTLHSAPDVVYRKSVMRFM